MNTEPKPTETAEQLPDRVLDRKQAAEFLRISIRKLSDLVASGELPSGMIGGRRVFLLSQLIEYARFQIAGARV